MPFVLVFAGADEAPADPLVALVLLLLLPLLHAANNGTEATAPAVTPRKPRREKFPLLAGTSTIPSPSDCAETGDWLTCSLGR
jgi:hypothetical protein